MAPASQPPPLRLVRILPAPPEEVFEAWTSPQSLAQWMCPDPIRETVAELDVRVGGQFRIVMRTDTHEVVHTGQYREITPPRRLVFTWMSSHTRGRETLVTIELSAREPDETELVLTHEGLPDVEAAESHQRGWTQIVEKLVGRLRDERRHA
jgi:uncharacterized protein YndB with AHSA1/START domain